MNPDPPTDDYPEVLEDAVRAFCSSGWGAGAAALEPIAGQVWREKVIRAAVVAEPSTAITMPGTRSRRFTPARAGATFRRDAFHCRYCGGRIVPVALMSLMSHLYPEQLPYSYTYKDVHPMYWTRGAEADHIEPGARGGDWDDPANHATACVRCNTAKFDCETAWLAREAFVHLDTREGNERHLRLMLGHGSRNRSRTEQK